ncbi:MAG: M48 family metalloprotease [Pseudomonadales bacterium]
MSRHAVQSFLFAPLLAVLLQACTTNPVTGQSELTFMSEAQELQIGKQQYLPTQQSQGGALNIDPSLTAYVQEVGQRLAAVSDRKLPYEFVVLNSSVPNAWALPGGKIAINRGLLTALENESELAAVLGHEIIHAAARHTAQAQTRGMLLQGALIASAIGARNSDYANLIVSGASLGAQLITQRYGRDAELESDVYGIRYMVRAGYDPRGAITLQEKFVELSKGRNPGWIEGLFASHPPSIERVRKARKEVETMDIASMDLRVGEQRYQKELAFIKEAAPAYALLGEAYEEIGEDDLEEAVDKLERAEHLLPQEAKFYGLQGDILLEQRRYREAITSYDAALARNDAYFVYYLGRGVANARLDNDNQARADLQRSTELLPTAYAAMELGNLALKENDRAAAMEYFRAAAQSGGEVGERATAAFVRLDMPQNPGNYFQTRVAVDQRGRLLAQVGNASGVPVSNVQVEFRVLVSGRVQSAVRRIQSMAPGASTVVDAGVTLPEEVASDARNYDARVVAATVQ